MSKPKIVRLAGLTGTGATLTAAKTDLNERIKVALTGEWDPLLVAHGENFALIVRRPTNEPLQWDFVTFKRDDSSRRLYPCANYATRSEAEIAALSHLAQMAGHYRGLEEKLSPAKREWLDGYFRWQAAYAKAKAAGKDDADCRSYADSLQRLAA